MAADAFLEYPDRNLLIADHAGSGKTLAYLVSLVQKLGEDEKAAGCRLTEPHSPRVIVVAPTAGMQNKWMDQNLFSFFLCSAHSRYSLRLVDGCLQITSQTVDHPQLVALEMLV